MILSWMMVWDDGWFRFAELFLRRLPLAVGGIAVNSVDDLDVDDLGKNLRNLDIGSNWKKLCIPVMTLGPGWLGWLLEHLAGHVLLLWIVSVMLF